MQNPGRESCGGEDTEIQGQEAWLPSGLAHSQNISSGLLSMCDRKMKTMIVNELQSNTLERKIQKEKKNSKEVLIGDQLCLIVIRE